MQDIVIGVDLGGTNIKAGAVSTDGKVLYRCRRSTDAFAGPDAVADRIADAARECVGSVSEAVGRASGVGIGSPGLIDSRAGVVALATNFAGFTDLPLSQMVEERTGLSCSLENDANVAALGEQWVGAGGGTSSLIMLTLGTGIGGGVVLDGKVWSGFGGVAGEIGHMCIDPDGPLCSCGKRGCIEAFASATGIVRRMREAIAEGCASAMAELGGALTSRDICEAACAGDEAARENMTMTGRYLGVAISNLMHILNPEVMSCRVA